MSCMALAFVPDLLCRWVEVTMWVPEARNWWVENDVEPEARN